MPKDGWQRVLQAERPLRVKFGIDATHHRLHLGHFVQLRLCRALQQRGHRLDLVLGTLTGRLGDPSGRDQTRPIVSEAQSQANADALLSQCADVLLPGFRAHLNHMFVKEMSVPDFLTRLVGRFTVASLLARDGFRKRQLAGQPIAAHELLVPLLQGFDSVVLRSEIEIGGTDQLFNFQITRTLQRAEGMAAQDVLMMPLIRGTDGKKMSKSEGNTISLDESPEEIFCKTMSIPDEIMEEWLPALTELECDALASELPSGLGTEPVNMQRKKALATDIVRQLRGEGAAERAREHFERTVQRREITSEVQDSSERALVTLVATVRGVSRSAARRLIAGGAVAVCEAKMLDPSHTLSPGDSVRIGRLVVRIR